MHQITEEIDIMQRLKPKFKSYQIAKNKKGQLFAVFDLMCSKQQIFTSQNGLACISDLPDRHAISYSREAIGALRQIHTRMAQADKNILDEAASKLDAEKNPPHIKKAAKLSFFRRAMKCIGFQ